MRLVYLAPAILGLFLVGCGADEPEDVDPPPATAVQPQAPVAPPAMPPASSDTSGDTAIDEEMSDGNSPPTDEMRDQQTDGSSGEANAPATGTTNQ